MEAWSPDELERGATTFALLWLRLSPMTLALPLLGLPSRPVVASAALSVAVTLSLWPIAWVSSTATADAPASLLALALREVLIGAVLALAMAAPLLSLRWAGALADRLLSPDDGQAPGAPPPAASTPLATLYLWCGLLVLLSSGGHRIAIETMGRHVIDTPVGAPAELASLQPALLSSARVLADALMVSLSLAGPVLVAALVVELAFGVAARLTSASGGGVTALSVRRLALIGVVVLGAPMLLGRLPALLRDALERAATIL